MYHHLNYFRECEKTRPVATAADRQKVHSRIQERLYITHKEIRAIKCRASTLNERLDNEIDLVSLTLTHLSLKIGNISTYAA